ncbi:long-chain-fatty-acid--CoA ligase [Mycolicibacterium anyangense]|uniref:Long-chain-fatty-acid--CoA ligase n=1 Tax=Mycolicibacterium anyangense TaxID=1431246 RepID=A0A6N4WFC3_9MYCO|nr:class I adenylate-forming enzyme family protein [Mycolicibacterium anyangense]BBZ78794.1 long-chain-fatty-acid--CoA ligase [Mycolicibacterium anyangense]
MVPCSITEELESAALNRPDSRLLVEPTGTVLTNTEVASLSAAAADWLAAHGVESTMTVAWQLPSHCAAAVLMLALSRSVSVQAPVLHLFRKREVAAALEIAHADVLIVDESTKHNAPPGTRVIQLPPDFLDVVRSMPANQATSTAKSFPPEQPRWVFFTSGTSGQPKGVQHSDKSLLTAARGYVKSLGLGSVPNDVGTINFPIAHVGGIFYLSCALIGEFPVLLLPRIESDIADVLAANRVTFTGSSTAFYQMLLSAQLASDGDAPIIPTLRMLIGGGAPCPPELHEKIRHVLGVPVLHGYGMTEAPTVTAIQPSDTFEQRSNTAGLPVPGAEVRIASTGEVEVRGDVLTPGYVDREQWIATVTQEGWLRTGDTGFLRSDGRLVITGRLKDLIIRKGENIAPAEIENELLAHPLIDTVAVLGLPDEARGEVVCAVVQRSANHPDVTLDEICRFLDERGFMKQKWPERLHVVDELPLTGLGKVSKRELAQQLTT